MHAHQQLDAGRLRRLLHAGLDVLEEAVRPKRIAPTVMGAALTAVATPTMHTMAMRIAAESLKRDIPIPSFDGFPSPGRWPCNTTADTRGTVRLTCLLSSARGGAVDSRTTRCASRTTCRGGSDGPPSIRSVRSSTAAAPMRWMGCATVVRGTRRSAAIGTSSNPTTEMSRGISRPASNIARMAPMAMASLMQKRAVGRFFPRRSCPGRG